MHPNPRPLPDMFHRITIGSRTNNETPLYDDQDQRTNTAVKANAILICICASTIYYKTLTTIRCCISSPCLTAFDTWLYSSVQLAKGGRSRSHAEADSCAWRSAFSNGPDKYRVRCGKKVFQCCDGLCVGYNILRRATLLTFTRTNERALPTCHDITVCG